MDDGRRARAGDGQRRRRPRGHVAQPVGRAPCSCWPTGEIFDGATEPPGGRHAEIVALDAARRRRRLDPSGASLVVTLEPCSHHGRTGPCADALDRRRRRPRRRRHRRSRPQRGRARASSASGPPASRSTVLRRRPRRRASSRPTSTTAAPAAPTWSSSWRPPSTAARPPPTARRGGSPGPEARADVHRLRADSDAVLVGAGTVRADDPELTVRERRRAATRCGSCSAPRRRSAKVHPCLELQGDLGDVLDTLGGKGVLQLLVEGGPTVAGAFHRAGLVDRYVVYLAPGAPRRRRRLPGARRPGRADDRRRVAGPDRRRHPARRRSPDRSRRRSTTGGD